MGRRLGAKRRFHGWLASWLQDRRRKRRFASGDPLEVGLVQFFDVVAGATHLKSWNETEPVPDNPLGAMGAVTKVAGSAYPVSTIVYYYVLPYREEGGVRRYAGLLRTLYLVMTGSSGNYSWAAWSAAVPSWVTGFTIVRLENWAKRGSRDLSAATMEAGWVDDGTGWSADETLPFTFGNPPNVAGIMWCMPGAFEAVRTMTTTSGLFGPAFVSSFDDLLVRCPSADVRRDVDGTLAYWVVPDDDTSGNLGGIRGGAAEKFAGEYSVEGGVFTFTGAFGQVETLAATGHQSGDCYLVVQRNDSLLGTLETDLFRVRDGAHWNGTEGVIATPVTEASDYWNEGLSAVHTIGSSGIHNAPGYGAFERFAIWDRPLSDEEVLDVFSLGLGWSPGG